ncbi:MAG: hypothetical protein IJ364_00510 [Oscillospiraceae bacterium]|nr:hypothetical protein [Oscillospiraceae bacterium]
MEFKKFKVYFNIGVGFFCLLVLAFLLVYCAVSDFTVSDFIFPIAVAGLFGPYFVFVNTKKLKKMKAAAQEQLPEAKEEVQE